MKNPLLCFQRFTTPSRKHGLAKARGTFLDMDIYDEDQEDVAKGDLPQDFLQHDASAIERSWVRYNLENMQTSSLSAATRSRTFVRSRT
jgi:hypothetical protein